ncbi:MAG: PLP-dependent aspartate aminotransferase family protein [Sandaracinaceae bacterium]
MAARFDTLAVHAGDESDPVTGALEAPVVLSNAFAFESAAHAADLFAGRQSGGIYGRWSNPTVRRLERKLAALEEGEDAVVLSSGMAAVHAALAAHLASGDHVVAAASLYAETGKLLRSHFARFGVETTFVDATDPASVSAALRDNTQLVYLETPSNPVLAVTDIEAVVEQAAARTVVVDSTFATPYHQRPLSLGADLVVHSATKGIAGHGDAIGGVVVGKRGAIEEVRRVGTRMCGGMLSPLSAMLIARGLRTLGLRAGRASVTALELATRLSGHPCIARVAYPGLTDHPGHAVASRQMRNGFGGLIAFEVDGGRAAGAAMYDRLELISRAVSLGDVRSLMTHPASTTHASWTEEERRAAGIGEGLARMSVGVEDVEDLWEDLDRALRG